MSPSVLLTGGVNFGHRRAGLVPKGLCCPLLSLLEMPFASSVSLPTSIYWVSFQGQEGSKGSALWGLGPSDPPGSTLGLDLLSPFYR